MLTMQKKRCAICKKKRPQNQRNLAVDHCHKSGKIRGLLCSRCNIGLGIFGDKVDLLQSAIDYLMQN